MLVGGIRCLRTLCNLQFKFSKLGSNHHIKERGLSLSGIRSNFHFQADVLADFKIDLLPLKVLTSSSDFLFLLKFFSRRIKT